MYVVHERWYMPARHDGVVTQLSVYRPMSYGQARVAIQWWRSQQSSGGLSDYWMVPV